MRSIGEGTQETGFRGRDYITFPVPEPRLLLILPATTDVNHYLAGEEYSSKEKDNSLCP